MIYIASEETNSWAETVDSLIKSSQTKQKLWSQSRNHIVIWPTTITNANDTNTAVELWNIESNLANILRENTTTTRKI